MNKIDLHSHTIYSDGTYEPNYLLKKANEMELKYFSITDHESVDAYFDLDKNLYDGNLVTGVELRTVCLGVIIEILGYNIDIKKMKKFIAKCNYLTQSEFEQYLLKKAYETYKEKGIYLPNDFVINYDEKKHKRPSEYIKNSILKFEQNKKYFYLLNGNSFYRTITDPNSEIFVDVTDVFPSIDTVLEGIKQSGGISSLAHIFVYEKHSLDILNIILANHKIDAIECFYSQFTKEQSDYLVDICLKGKKLITGGSDFHGENRKEILIGRGKNNNLNIPEKLLIWLDNI